MTGSRRAATGALAGLLVGCAVVAIHLAHWTERWGHPVQDLAFRLRPHPPENASVVAIGITAHCIEELGPLPWPRQWFGKAIERLNDMGASVIAFDVFFPDPSQYEASGRQPGEQNEVGDDAAFAAAVREAGNVVLPVFDQYRGAHENVILLRENIDSLTEAAAGIGHINVVSDTDGVVRRAPVRVGSLNRGYLQLGLMAAALHTGIEGPQLKWGEGFAQIGTHRLPVDEDRNLLINWRPPSAWEAPGRLLTFWDLWNGDVTEEDIRGKIVLIGQTSPGLPNADQIPTPFGPRYGLFAQADIAASAARGQYIRPCARWPYAILLIALSSLIGALLPGLRLTSLLGVAAALTATALAACFAVFWDWGLLVDFVPLALVVSVNTGGTLAWSLARARTEVRRQEETLDVLREASEDMANLILKALSASTEDMSVLGATGAYAESLQVPEVTPPIILRSMAAALGARWAFMAVQEDGRAAPTWLSIAPEENQPPEDVRDFAEALVPLVERDGRAVLVPNVRREPALKDYADHIDSALAVRLALGESTLATVVLCGKSRTPISPTPRFELADLRTASAMAPQGSLLLDHARLHRILRSLLARAVGALTAAMHARDPYTRGHSERVAYYAVFLARATGLSEQAVEAVELGALLHDLGKIGMDEELLRGKQGLTEREWALVRQHPVTGSEIVAGLEELSFLVPAVRHHHERYDGAGYPDGLEGEEIPLLARVMAIADAFDAMTFERSYRAAPLSFGEACAELSNGAGTQFDPELALLFVEHATPGLITSAWDAAQEGDGTPRPVDAAASTIDVRGA
jgi:HD-GYP domain-containing protein (c-di-GMP phosphodiesterase class II)/CHASE2 domain-containing sensor protein